MSNLRATPGPWTWKRCDNGDGGLAPVLVGPNDEIVMYAHSGESASSVLHDPALIAAAPDLYAALEAAVEWLEEEGCDCGTDEPGTCALCVSRAALRRARGEA